jgi:hypothetical protein
MSAPVDLPRPTESLQQQLQRQRAEAQENTTVRLPIPGYGGRLIGVYHLIDYKTQRRIVSRNMRVQGKDKEDREATQELYTAADNLLACCDHVEVRVPLEADESAKTEAAEFNAAGHKLGVAFAEYLGLHDPDKEEQITPRGAIFLIIPQPALVVAHAGQLMGRQGIVDQEIDEEQLGEADAVS